MTRASVTVVIFLVCLNASAGAIAASGVGESLGIDYSVGANEDLDETEESAEGLSPDTSGDGDFSLISAALDVFGVAQSVFSLATAGPQMLANIGVPAWLTGVLFAPMYLLVFADLAYIVSGRLL